MTRSLAVVTTIPGRQEALEQCLVSLRPQVDLLMVIANGYTTKRDLPHAAYILADGLLREPDDCWQSAAKLSFVREWGELYLCCDDDLAYPPDYVSTLRGWFTVLGPSVLLTAHGRILTSPRFQDAAVYYRALEETPFAWVNYPGGCALAFQPAGLPATLPTPFDVGAGQEEAGLAVWAQRHRVPIAVIPHAAGWLRYLLPKDAPTMFKREKARDFGERNDVLAGHQGPWQVFARGGR